MLLLYISENNADTLLVLKKQILLGESNGNTKAEWLKNRTS